MLKQFNNEALVGHHKNMKVEVQNLILNCVGWTSVALGVIGVFLPILPTTPFIILAAACFSKSSPRFHGWLLDNKYFGPGLRAWEEHRVISPRSKVTAIILLNLGLSGSAYLVRPPTWTLVIFAAISISVSAFILLQKSKAP